MKAVAVILSLYLASVAASGNSKIVGGQPVDPPGKWPWQGALLNGGSHSCGCVLVSPNYVITAAHCVTSDFLDRYSVVLGQHSRTDSSVGSPETFQVIEKRSHPAYDGDGSKGFPNDIAILKLSQPVNVTANDYIEIVPLNNRTDLTSDECYITGWGRTCGSCALPAILQETVTNVITLERCRELWYAITAVEVHDFHVCLFDEVNRATGACNGDSGGPLVCRESATDAWHVCGVTSWGLSGCGTTAPSVYTRVSYYLNWICGWTDFEPIGCQDILP